MLAFYKDCLLEKKFPLEACSEDIMYAVGIDKNVIKQCQNKNVRHPEEDNSIVENLEAQKNKFIEEEIMIWPSLFINNLTYRGELESNETIETICQALKSQKKPALCGGGGKQLNNNNLLSWGIVCLIILFMVLFMIFFYYLYQRAIHKEVDKEIQIQVNSSVAQYFALQEQKK
eukprot:TRINITY_DN8065_c0_g1_i2.p2 TRINITY_DN8065_c0_g1~~TRINITY_DN8065_c0_g1_i2.p2  ORF type:complete len:174 (-),score=31.27 TRINITY_DN8065_c0_g1_i2:53-574(-)